MLAAFKSFFGKRDKTDGLDKKQEKLEKKFGLESGTAQR